MYMYGYESKTIQDPSVHPKIAGIEVHPPQLLGFLQPPGLGCFSLQCSSLGPSSGAATGHADSIDMGMGLNL